MNRSQPLAHSPRQDVCAQTYIEHVSNVKKFAAKNAKNASTYYNGERQTFISWVKRAALYHDLGKLDLANQAVLNKDSRKPLPIAHEDAGVAALWKQGSKESATLVAAHHAGMFSKSNETYPNKKRSFRDEREFSVSEGIQLDEYIDAHLNEYLNAHEKAGLSKVGERKEGQLHRCGLSRRIALSCLVDADHGDTARHYRKEIEIAPSEPRWNERLNALRRYVSKLPKGSSKREQDRNDIRKRFFESCDVAPISPSIRTCDAPVGSGKTTAVMAHLLRVAAERTPPLRHIIVVLPYTNIITQSVDTYRKALLLDGERPEDIVAEHHHKADFESMELRQLATLWKSPIIVTTAVQFFETLGSHHPARLRKLHELPGSAIFVDETHAAIPSHLWPQMWRWLGTWTKDWGGHLVLASGSLPRFWELNEFREITYTNNSDSMPDVPDLVEDISLRSDIKSVEEARINYRRRPDNDKTRALDCLGVVKFIEAQPGPRLLIVNTVHTAAVIAHKMREIGIDTLHISTALAPIHRDLIVKMVKKKLKSKKANWTLVATSCVEAGMNFSFQTGFRERSSTASLIQIGGRVSRGDEFEDAVVWDILLQDDRFRSNPSISIARQVLDRFTVDELNKTHPSELASIAMKMEWNFGAEEKAKQIIRLEERMEYPDVSSKCKVIDTDTRTVIIDRAFYEALRNGDKVSRIELMKHSVQIWANKINKLSLQPVFPASRSSDSDIYFWQYDYDPEFIGYMEGVLKLDKFIEEGGAII